MTYTNTSDEPVKLPGGVEVAPGATVEITPGTERHPRVERLIRLGVLKAS